MASFSDSLVLAAFWNLSDEKMLHLKGVMVFLTLLQTLAGDGHDFRLWMVPIVPSA